MNNTEFIDSTEEEIAQFIVKARMEFKAFRRGGD